MENLYFPIRDHGPTLQSQGLMPSFEFSVLDMPLGQQPVPTDEYAEDLEESVQYLDDDVCEECKRKAMRKYRDMTLPDPATFDPGYATRSAAARRQRGFEEARMRGVRAGYAARRQDEDNEAAILRIERKRQQLKAGEITPEQVRGRSEQRGGSQRRQSLSPVPGFQPLITEAFPVVRGRPEQRKAGPGERGQSVPPGQPLKPEPAPGQFVPESKEPMGPPPPGRRRL